MFYNNKWTTSDNKIIEVNNTDLDKGIWRCYWNKQKSIWEPKDKRQDKFKPNNSNIETQLKTEHLYPYKLTDINSIINQEVPYYQLKYLNYGVQQNNVNKNLVYNIKKYSNSNKNVIDIGCGYSSNKLSQYIKFNSWLGIDKDISTINYYNNLNLSEKYNWLWYDFANKDNISYNLYQNINSKIDKKFDIIIMTNTIHYAATKRNSWDNMIQMIDDISNSNCYIIITYLDEILLEETFKSSDNDSIIYNGNFVKKCKSLNTDISNYWIKIFYKNKHLIPIIEPVVNKNTISNT